MVAHSKNYRNGYNMSQRITIIVPVYNAEQTLHRCIDSILAQTITDFDLILVDDGSTDASGAICDAYATADSRVCVFHKSNGGVSSARNLGLENAHTEWVTFVDSDDFVYDSYLDNYDLNTAAPYDLLCQGLKCTYGFVEDNRQEDVLSLDFDGYAIDLLDPLFCHNCVGYSFNKAFRLSIIREHSLKFNTNLKFMEDEVFVLSYIRFATTARSSAKLGYFYANTNDCRKYFLPHNKAIYLHSLIIDLIHDLDLESHSPCFLRHRRRLLTELYLKKIASDFDLDSTRELREYHLANHSFSPLNKICRNILIYDPTLFFSTIAICCHMRLRAWLKL